MTDADETQLMCLATQRGEFTEAEAFTLLGAKIPADREEGRALIQDMTHRGRLRATGPGRYAKVRLVLPEPAEKPSKVIPPRPMPTPEPAQGNLFRGDL
jgi:hypothetical protein